MACVAGPLCRTELTTITMLLQLHLSLEDSAVATATGKHSLPPSSCMTKYILQIGDTGVTLCCYTIAQILFDTAPDKGVRSRYGGGISLFPTVVTPIGGGLFQLMFLAVKF